jgi:vitamin B12 transporter
LPRARQISLFSLSFLLASRALAQQAPTIPALQTTIVVLGAPDVTTAGESSRSGVTLDTQQHRLASRDIEDYLRTDASVDIQQRGAANTQADISIRGASFEQTLVLLNGLRINDAQTSHFNLDIPVPLEAVQTIEVLHGAGSTLYGSDAIGGVVDFITLRPKSTTLRLRAGGGTFNENQQSVLGSYASKRGSQVLTGSREQSDGFIADRDFLTKSGSSETRIATPLGDTAILLAGSDRSFGASQFYGPYKSFEHTKGWFASLNQPLGPNTLAAVGYRRHSDIFVLFRDRPAYYTNQHVDESWQAVLRRHDTFGHYTTFSYGAEENTDAIHSNNLGQHARNRTAGYANLDLRASQHGTLSVGLRGELFSGGRTALSPQLAGTLWPHRSVKLRASVGSGFRLPTYTDLYYTDPTHISNPNLKPESAWNYDGGLDWYLNDRTAASLTIFHSRQTNAIDYVRTGPTAPYQASNLINLHFTGVESSVDWHPTSRQHLKASWTLLIGAQAALHGLQSDYISNYPTHNASLQWTESWKQGLLLRTRLGVTQRYQQTAYPVWDAAFVRESGRIHPFVQISNLSNTGYQQVTNVRMPSRTLTGGIELFLSRTPR